MAGLGLSDVLTLVQTIAIISTLIMTLYYTRRQLHAFSVDLETRVLNDLDEKTHHLVEIFMETPSLIKMIYDIPGKRETPEDALAYYVNFLCSHIYHMRERKVLSDNEWEGWLQWMKNAYRYGKIGKFWKENEMESWFDPSFKNFF